MKKKLTLYSELCYVFGVILLALGTACMERGDLGLSSVVAPAYLIYLKLSQYFDWFTFGRAEYLVQGLLLLLMCIVIRRFKVSFLFSFVTALIYGTVLDLMMDLVALIPSYGMAGRIALYIIGFFICLIAISLLFHTYISPEVYELFVMQIARRFKIRLGKVKIIFDYSTMLLSVILSFAFFGWWHFEGIKIGTVLCALVNGWLVFLLVKFIEDHFEIKDALKLRHLFDLKEKD
jgi:uncharacterized membrane protein YczE